MSHIIEKHGENVARNVIEVLAKGTESDTQKNDKETGAYAAVEVYDPTGATADGTTRFHPNGVNATVSNDSISDTSIKGNRSEEKFSVEDDSQYLSLAEKYRDGDITTEETEQLKEAIEQAARKRGYDSPILYHGTDSFGFTEFDLSKENLSLLRRAWTLPALTPAHRATAQSRRSDVMCHI